MPIAPQLQRFVDEELALAPELIERCLMGTVNLLSETRVSSNYVSGKLQTTLVDDLQRQKANYVATFVQSLRRKVTDDLQQQQSGGADAGSGFAGLELMDESRVEVDIEISRAMQLIDSTADWELRELQTFTSTLVGLTHVSADSNPLRPLVYATSLWDAACVVTGQQEQRALLLRTSAGVAAGLLKKAWAAASTRLESRGIEPGVYRTVVFAAGSVPGRGATGAPNTASTGVGGPSTGQSGGSAPAGLSALLRSLPGAPRGASSPSGFGTHVGTFGMKIASGSTVGTDLDLNLGGGTRGADFELALQRLDETLRQHAAAAFAAAASQGLTQAPPLSQEQRDRGAVAAELLSARQEAVVASAGSSNERQVIELVTRFFDTLLTDPQLAAPIHSAIARLQVPAMRLAIRESGLMESTAHPLWKLVDRLALVSAARPPADARTQAVCTFAESLADALSKVGTPDNASCRRAIDQLEAFMTQQLNAQVASAATSIDNLRFAERREKLEQMLVQRLTDQLAPMRISPSIRRFLLTTWAKVLAESMLRLGDQDEATRGYVKLVDDLTWSLQLPDHPQSRQRLIALLPGLLQRLRAGMAMVSLPAPEQQTVLDELMAVHTEALRPTQRAANELTPEQLVQRMRDEVMPETPAGPSFSDSVIDLSSMETVPAEFMNTDVMQQINNPSRAVDALQIGEFKRLFVQGRWQRVQLLWRSEHGLFLLFAGEAPRRTHSIARRALERLAGAGLIQPLQPRPTVERALDALGRELALPAA